MPARLYSNENFHRQVVLALRELGHDVLTSVEAGRANQRIPDEAVIEFAKREGRAVLTFNRLHFLRLHRSTNAEHAGIIVCTTDHDTAALAQRIDQAIREAGVLDGQLLRVNRPAK
ncbi:DUF5615 family PIN-like protein [Prosthecobacter sp.]|uniref:DUF5615 family PIN-like protein n=1 Tax=Prosthecobacter sp. TaxID=1965333 RepID=UPI002AB95650|nr:DUF5615 family PIN-like protein [Prosthecobacter sp.]MDZ4405616.1 DUF5615 family PIN-like protein [Prosthecobacter sp.]